MPKTTKQQKDHNPGTLERLFNSAPARILDFLQVFRNYDYSKQDIAKNSNVSFRHAIREIDRLEKLGLITKTRNVGHSHMYKFNTENETAMLLQKFALKQALDECEREAKKQTKQEPTTETAKAMVMVNA
ncbi:MAG: hypothetical protein FWC33_02815 [Candidatus Bathyarchaeota archaeon]|nr:hypothetical protein [Candidatus Termiticorpusculum sp.]